MGRHTAETPQIESEFAIPQLVPDDAPEYVNEVAPAPATVEHVEHVKPAEPTRARLFDIPELAPIDDAAIAPEVGETNTAGVLGFATRPREERRRVAPARTPLEREQRRENHEHFMDLQKRKEAEAQESEERERVVTAGHLARRALVEVGVSR